MTMMMMKPVKSCSDTQVAGQFSTQQGQSWLVNRSRRQEQEYKLLCPRGTQTCALAVANIKVNGNGKVILDTHPESDQHQN